MLSMLLVLAVPAWAVDLDATLKGVVTDPDGLEVPGAEVVLDSDQGPRNVLTDDVGRYRFATLPPGIYVVRVIHPSFAPWESAPLNVALGATIDIDVTLALQGDVEVITIVDAAPAVDMSSVQSGATLDASFLKNVPSGRDYQSAISTAPGIVGGGNPNARGSFDTSNQYYIDGVNVTDPVTNTFSMNMNYDAIESIEVITGGMDAEYGRALGSAFNIVTKSGSNQFEGTALYSYSGSGTVLAPLLPGETRSGQYGAQQAVFNLGGPIVQDKAFFFTSVEFDKSEYAASIDPDEIPRDLSRFPLQPYDYRSAYLFGKVTFQPTDTHRLWLHLQGDPTVIYNLSGDPYTLPSGETMQKQGGYIASLGHQFTPSDRVIVKTQLFHSVSYLDFSSILWRDCQDWDGPVCTTDFVGADYLGQEVTEGWIGYDAGDFSSGEYPNASFDRRLRSSLDSSITLFADLLGEHEFKTGVQAEVVSSTSRGHGLITPYFANGGDPMDLTAYTPQYAEISTTELDEHTTGSTVSYYLQDAWSPLDRLLLKPGVRFDYATLNNDVGESVVGGLTVAPRFGATFDVTGDGKTKLFAFYGRFYDTGYLGIASILNKGDGAYGGYAWDEATGTWSAEPLFLTASTFIAAPDLRNPYSDEVDVGLSREIGEGLSFDVNFTYEESRRFWEDDDVNLIWNDEGTEVVGSRDGTGAAQYRLRTPDDAYTKYTSVELVMQKDWSEEWSMLASYTWSRATGTNSADGATSLFDIPPQRKYEAGLLDYDIPHNLKVSGSYTKPELVSAGRLHVGYVLGWNSYVQSGYPYRKIVWNDEYQDYYNYESVGDGRYRLPMLSSTDLRAMAEFSFGDTDEPKANWGVGVDVFNVFDDRTITDVDSRYIPDAQGDDQPFGTVTDIQNPRQFQVVVRGGF